MAAATGAPGPRLRNSSGAKTISESFSSAAGAREGRRGSVRADRRRDQGLGKSRLVEEFRGRLAETPHSWVEWTASQLLQNTALNPLTEWGRQRFGADAAAERRLAGL